MKELFEKRINLLRENLLQSKDALLICNEVNIGYFTGFFHSEGYLVVTHEACSLFVDFRYHEAALKKSFGCKVVCYKKLAEDIASFLKTEGAERLAFEPSYLTVERAERFKTAFSEHKIEFFADYSLDTRVSSLRIIKEKTELDKIKTAQKIAEKAYLEMLNYVKPGVTERELAARLQFFMKLYGAEDISFDLITITGAKTALPHGVPSDDIVRDGDFFTCDFGAVYDGYHSDTTRTVAVGHATEEMRRVYDVVLSAQLAALKEIAAGTECSRVDAAAREIIKKAGYGEYFGHSTGHGVGLEIHEAPSVSPRCDTVLESGMVITDEPGIYLPGRFGVRIEDMMAVTENGCDNFVSLPKELLII